MQVPDKHGGREYYPDLAQRIAFASHIVGQEQANDSLPLACKFDVISLESQRISAWQR